MGVAVADMGASSIELAAYLEGDLQLAVSLPVGGEHFVNDIAAVLRTPREAAEQIISGRADRAAGHATSGPALQQNLVCALAVRP